MNYVKLIKPLWCFGLVLVLVGAGCKDEKSTNGGGDPADAGEVTCTPGSIICLNNNAMVCNDQGTGHDFKEDCFLSGGRCNTDVGCYSDDDAGNGTDSGGGNDAGPYVPPGSCTPGEQACVVNTVYFCQSDASWVAGTDCSRQGRRCEEGQCVGCRPGTTLCQGNLVVECHENGTDVTIIEECATGRTCVDGHCISQCEVSDGKISYQGCEYWAVDLENAAHPHNHFAVAISNVSEEAEANIKIYKGEMENNRLVETVVAQGPVAPQELRVFELPSRPISGSRVAHLAYRVATDHPVIAYQFNPLNNSDDTYSNDATLLFPSSALDSQYIAITGDAVSGSSAAGLPQNWGATLTVVGVTRDSTMVEVTIPEGISFNAPRGADVNGNVITARLEEYRVLHVVSRSVNQEAGNGNLTGARVSASAPVAVFAGNVATVVPHGPDAQCCADHLEAQLMPVSTWGKNYVVGHSFQRRVGSGSPIADYWTIVASENDTTLNYTPRRPTGTVDTLNAGQSVHFSSSDDFVVQADKPISIMQFLPSSYQAASIESLRSCTTPGVDDEMCTVQSGFLANCNDIGAMRCTPLGDPSMLPIPPVEQFRKDYLFLTPLDYQMDFITVVAPQGTNVTLNGDPLTEGWQVSGTIGTTVWNRLAVQVTPGVHRLISDQPVGLTVYGLDRDVSYGYVGGLDLERINR